MGPVRPYSDSSDEDARATDDVLLQQLLLATAGEDVGPRTFGTFLVRGWLRLRQTDRLTFRAYLTAVGSRELEAMKQRHARPQH